MDYTSQLQSIITQLSNLIDKLQNLTQINDLLFLVMAIFLVIFVIRGE